MLDIPLSEGYGAGLGSGATRDRQVPEQLRDGIIFLA